MEMLKKCNRCLHTKSISDFYKSSTGNYMALCKKCTNEKNTERYYKNNNSAEQIQKRQALTKKQEHIAKDILNSSRMCTFCMTKKHISEFSIDRRSNYGINTRCKTCINELARKKYKIISDQNKAKKYETDKLIDRKMCTKCKIEKGLNLFHRRKTGKFEVANICKECSNASHNEYYKKNRERINASAQIRKIYNPVHASYIKYKTNAKSRNIDFSLDEEDFKSVVCLPCHYCGVLPENASFFKINGIDRKDNNAGYSNNNCLPCCIDCNRAKRTKEYSQYIEWVKRSYDNIVSKEL